MVYASTESLTSGCVSRITIVMFTQSCDEGKEGGREGGREGGMEGGMEGGREGGSLY